MEIFWCALKNFLFIRLRKELSTHLFINWVHNSKHNIFALTFLQCSCRLEPSSRTSLWGGSLVLGFFTFVFQGLIWAVENISSRKQDFEARCDGRFPNCWGCMSLVENQVSHEHRKTKQCYPIPWLAHEMSQGMEDKMSIRCRLLSLESYF